MVATLADRSKYERVAKSLIFMPMAISFVGASVIWNFVYEVKPAGNARRSACSMRLSWRWEAQPHAWPAYTAIAPWNNLFLVVIVIWLQTGYCHGAVLGSLKGIPEEILEAARVDGATEIQVFFGIMIPYIRGTIITVYDDGHRSSP